MTEKSSSIESLESRVFEITIAHLANTNKEVIDNDFIELNDVKISMDLFKNCFFNNNSRFFELNHQFREIDALKLNNKTVKYANFKSDKNGAKLDLYDVMLYKYLKNKKTKMNDGSRLILMKELSNHTSLIDFAFYKNHLSYENILSALNHSHHRKNKKYFRYKLKVNYYSDNLDENLVLYFNYLVKIPKKHEESNDNEEDISIISEEEQFDDDSTVDGYNEKNKAFQQPEININPHENIIYSNYVKKLHTKITHPKLITNEIDNSNGLENNLSDDDDDDASSESNLTTSSLNDNETNDTFF
jgi:hypothetical protein